jgi:hypothetical protein
VFVLLPPRKRYGLKSKSQRAWIVLAFLLIGLVTVLPFPTVSYALDGSWWGSSAWWDWSDFRGAVGARVFLARLASATVTGNGVDFDLKGSKYGFDNEPAPFDEVWGILYIDRLGFSFHAEENTFRGRIDTDQDGTTLPNPVIPELEFSSSRLGLELDLIRYPFFRFGIDYDYYVSDVKFLNSNGVRYSGVPPMTLGFHARAIPARIREVPFTIQARFRFPMPLVNRQAESKITDWEISGGFRPAVWETSLYGHATFSFDIEAGFRSVNLDANPTTNVSTSVFDAATGKSLVPPTDLSLKARWQGAFFQVGMFF